MKTLAQKYNKKISLIVPIFLLLIIIFNYLIDPFAVFFNGEISNKSAFSTHTRMAKAHIIRSIKPKTIILGTSRAENGLNPDHPGFQAKPVYNLALSGASIYEISRYFQHANGIRPLKQVILAVDFFQFNMTNSLRSGYLDERLTVDLDGKKQPYPLFDLASMLGSIDAVRLSFDTVNPYMNIGSGFLDNGQKEHTHYTKGIKRVGGQRNAFLIEAADYFSNIYFPRPLKIYQFEDVQRGTSTFNYFRGIVKLCYQNRIDLKIIISPSHAFQWEIIASADLWDKWEHWKREIVKINDAVAHIYEREAFPLWDFSGYNHYTTETVPLLGDIDTAMQWYWESSHYRNELGELVLDRIFNYQHSDRTLFEGFGVLITSDNIEQHLLNIRQDRQNYRLTHKEDILEIENLARKYLKKKAVLTQ